MTEAVERHILQSLRAAPGLSLSDAGASIRVGLDGGKAAVSLTLGFPMDAGESAALEAAIAAALGQQGLVPAGIEVRQRIAPHAVQPNLSPLPRGR